MRKPCTRNTSHPWAHHSPTEAQTPPHCYLTEWCMQYFNISHLAGITPHQLLLCMQEVVRGCRMPSLEQMTIVGVQFTSKTRMKVFVNSEDDDHELLQSSNVWIPKLALGAVLVVWIWSMVVHSIPTTFHPQNQNGLAYLYEHNPEVTPCQVAEGRCDKEQGEESLR